MHCRSRGEQRGVLRRVAVRQLWRQLRDERLRLRRLLRLPVPRDVSPSSSAATVPPADMTCLLVLVLQLLPALPLLPLLLSLVCWQYS